MNYLLLILSTIFLLISCPQSATPPESEPGDTSNMGDNGLSGSIGGIEQDLKIEEGVMIVPDSGFFEVPDNNGRTLYSVHVLMATTNDGAGSLSSQYEDFRVELRTTGTPPASNNIMAKQQIMPSIQSPEVTSIHASAKSGSYDQEKQDAVVAFIQERNTFDVGETGPINAGALTQEPRYTTAKVVAESENAYFFVETAYVNTFEGIKEAYIRSFEENYVKMERAFGGNLRADNGGNKFKIIIVEFAGSGISGTIGNGRQILVSQKELGNFNTSIATVFHEMQHSLYLNGKDLWLTEGLSEYARDITTLNLEGYVPSLFSAINTKRLLAHGGQFPAELELSYTYGYIFIQYLVDRFGEEILPKICNADTGGKRGVHPVVVATGMDFDKLFFDFAIAVALHGVRDYKDPNIKEEYTFTNAFRSKDNAGNFIDGAFIRIPLFEEDNPPAGGHAGFADGSGLEHQNPLNPYSVLVLKWQGDVDTITVPVPADKRNRVIKSAVFYGEE